MAMQDRDDTATGGGNASRQFSLRTLLIAITILCALLALAAFLERCGDDWLVFSLLGWSNLVVVAALVVAIVYGHGRIRAVCIGALVPTGMFGLMILANPHSLDTSLIISAFLCAYFSAATAGFVSALVHRFMTSKREPRD